MALLLTLLACAIFVVPVTAPSDDFARVATNLLIAGIIARLVSLQSSESPPAESH
jgi:hypothetical protein